MSPYIEIKFFEEFLRDSDLRNRLTENNFSPHFTLKKKLYYKFLRPILPIPVRQKLQEKLNRKIEWKENFIDDSLVNEVIRLYIDKLKKLKYNNDKEVAIVLTHDVEEQHGFDFIPKVIDLEEKYGFKSSWNIVPYKYKIDEGILKDIRDNRHEIGIHGYNHDGKLYYSENIFNERVPYINDAIKRYYAVGFRSPQVHRNLVWLQKLNIEYDASCFDYDPFQPFPGGTGSIWPFIAGKFVELPYTLLQDHTLFYVLKQKDISIWRNKADWVAKNNGVILLITHPDYLREKNNLKIYEEFLKYIKSFENAWFCLPREIAGWWKMYNKEV